jgi:hypothetical protein
MSTLWLCSVSQVPGLLPHQDFTHQIPSCLASGITKLVVRGDDEGSLGSRRHSFSLDDLETADSKSPDLMIFDALIQ